MEQIFHKIEDNIFETRDEIGKNIDNKGSIEDTTTDSTQFPKKIKDGSKTEKKSKRLSKLHLEKPEENIEEKENEENNEKNEKENEIDKDEYSDYGRVDKRGIHFQIISDFNVSIEIVPEELLSDDVKSLILKYKGVYDDTLKLWVLPYINYEPLYNELNQIEGIGHKLHKVGSIAKECYEHKNLTTLIIKRKKEDEKIDYTNDVRERKVEQLPQKLLKALYDFQIEGINFGIEHHCRFLLADEMGVGKTIQAISLSYIYRDSWPVLIVCPGSMKYLWKSEIRAWLGLKDHRINIINNSKQKLSSEAYFYIISYDLVKNILKKLKRMSFDFVILDEAHSIKNRESIRAKNILPIAVRAKRLIIMTGTPLLAKPYEGYPLLYALRPDLFCYFKKYAYRYCDPQPTPFGINWSGASNTKELHWIISTLMVRRLKKDVLNRLPPKRRQKVFIKTDNKIIEEIKKVRINIKGTKGILDSYSLTGKAKVEGVYEFVSDLLETGEKFIVFAYHHEMLDKLEFLMKERKIEYIRIDGSTQQDRRYVYVNNFQQNKNCKVAILSIIAASTGITLTSAHIVIFAELTWTPSIMIQAEDRAHRIGQKSNFVDIKYLYGPETLDDFILDKLQKKLTIVSTTLDDKKEILGVDADPNLIHVKGKKSKDSINIEYEDDEYNEEDDEDEEIIEENIKKKMIDDLGLDEKSKEKSQKKKRKTRNKSKNKKLVKSKTKDAKDSNISKKINLLINSSSKNKEPTYPKEFKRTKSMSEIKKENGSKISGIKELRRSWASQNKRSAKKYQKFIREKLDDEISKKGILNLVNDNKTILKENMNNINNVNYFNAQENVNDNENINLNINVNTNNDFKDYEKCLSVNLHKTNNRRTTTEEETKITENPMINLIKSINNKNIAETKKLLFTNNKNIYNENMDDNITQNMKDKVPLI